jgi:paraquat-inducible protein B
VSSGVQVSVGAQGLTLATESLQTLLTGGIVFDTPEAALTGPPSPAGAIFHLYPNPADAADAADPLRVAYRLYFPDSLHGVMVDTPVELRGLTIGHVSSVRLEYDPASGSVRVPVTIKIALNKIRVHGQEPFAPDQEAQARVAADRLFSRLIAEGLRAELVSGSLLTGSRVISLSFVKDAAPASLISAKPYPEFPTAPGSGLDEIAKSASTFMNNLAALPLASLVGDVRDMVRHTDGLVSSPELRRSLKELDRTLASAQSLTEVASQRIGPLMDRLDNAAKQLNATLTLLGDDPKSSVDLASTMAELRDAARSVKVLSTYLERNPQALLLGKSEDALR